MMQRPPQDDFQIKGIKPKLGGWLKVTDKLTRYDLVEEMQYLYVEVVEAIDLPGKNTTGTCDPYAEVKLGNYKGRTRHFVRRSNPKWGEVFAFSMDQIHASVLQVLKVTVKDKDYLIDDFMGQVSIDWNKVVSKTVLPPDRTLAPQWYRLENLEGQRVRGGLKLALWIGTQADHAFPKAWHSDAATVCCTDALANIKSNVYFSPKLWYLRVNVIEALNLISTYKSRFPDVSVKAILGNQVLSTAKVSMKSDPKWNEDLMFVAAEPFNEPLILGVEVSAAPNINEVEVLGEREICLQTIAKRHNDEAVKTKWYDIAQHDVYAGGKRKKVKFASRIHTRICLEGGYHVFDESIRFTSDLRPAAEGLRKKTGIGVLELGILNAEGLSPMKIKFGQKTTDAYCVAKYGQKWIRTRTIGDSVNPKWNEQYTWEVFDPCTVVTIGVFDNCHLGGAARDTRIGKVRIRLSTLETNRVYTHSYPLLVLYPSGVKKMGEIHLAVRFSCLSLLNMMCMYTQPLLPKMHYIHPLTVSQLDNLRHCATQIVSMRFSRAEAPLGKEIVEYMLDDNSRMWSMGRSKANDSRIMGVLSGPIAVCKWFDQICNWKNQSATLLIYILFLILVFLPKLILPGPGYFLPLFLIGVFLIGVWHYRRRPRDPPHMDTHFPCADDAHPVEFDEEFDTFPTSCTADIVRMRYDRLRRIGGTIQTVVGELATQGERLQSLLSWRDPRATFLFVIFCLVAAIGVFFLLYFIGFEAVAIVSGFYVMRHPSLRDGIPSVFTNFLSRLPARRDSML